VDKEKDADLTRRTFLESAASAAALTGVFPILSSVLASEQEGVTPSELTGGKIISMDQRTLPYGKEGEAVFEWTRTNGRTDTTKAYSLKVNVDGGYVVFTHVVFTHHFSRRHGSVTLVLKGTKGAINDDKRNDTIEATIIGEDGTTKRLPPRNVQVLLNSPYEGLTPDETLQRMLKEKWR